MIKKLFLPLTIISSLAFAQDIVSDDSKKVAEVDASVLNRVIKLENPQLQLQPPADPNQPGPGPGAGAGAAVQPQAILKFSLTSLYAEEIQTYVVSDDWEDQDQYGRRKCTVVVTKENLIRPQRNVGPALRRTYSVQVSSDSEECRSWKLLNVAN